MSKFSKWDVVLFTVSAGPSELYGTVDLETTGVVEVLETPYPGLGSRTDDAGPCWYYVAAVARRGRSYLGRSWWCREETLRPAHFALSVSV